jgi:hypothetical protein
MPPGPVMRAFEVSLNGQYQLTAGIGHRDGVLYSMLLLDQGVLRYELCGWDAKTAEIIVWPVPEIQVGDLLSIKLIETEGITRSSFRLKVGSRDAADPARNPLVSLKKKYMDAAAQAQDRPDADAAEVVAPDKRFELSHNGQYQFTAGLAGDAGILYWVVENLSTILNDFVSGFDVGIARHVCWWGPHAQVGDNVTVKIIESEYISPQFVPIRGQRL